MKRGDLVRIKHIVDYKGIVINKENGKFKVFWYKTPYEPDEFFVESFSEEGLELLGLHNNEEDNEP